MSDQPGSAASAVRPERRPASTEPVLTALMPLLAALTETSDGAAVSVLDCGGGSGRYAVPLAVAGCHVTVIDVSADALSTLRLRAVEAGAGDRVRAVQADVEAIEDGVAALGTVDLVLAHGVLEAVDDVAGAVRAMAARVRPGGLLSIVVANPVAVVLARALGGDLAGALRELDQLDASTDPSGRRPGPDGVTDLCAAAGLVLERRAGVGVFRDLVPGAALDVAGAKAALDLLELRCAERSPFAEIAAQVHLLARRPAG